MPVNEQGMRDRIANFLPKALERAVVSYKMIALDHPVHKETKETDTAKLKKQHEACKVAIAHIELLLKLARMSDIKECDKAKNDAATQEELLQMLNQAQGEVSAFHKRQSDEV